MICCGSKIAIWYGGGGGSIWGGSGWVGSSSVVVWITCSEGMGGGWDGTWAEAVTAAESRSLVALDLQSDTVQAANRKTTIKVENTNTSNPVP